MGSNDIKKKIDMILGKKKVRNQKDFMKVYGVGLGMQKRGRRKREPLSLREHYQKKRRGVDGDKRSKYKKLPQLNMGKRG